jgi:hypothetical protein
MLSFNIWFYFRCWQTFFVASFAKKRQGMPLSALTVPNYVVMTAYDNGSQKNVHNALTVEHHYSLFNWSSVVGLKR